MAAVIGDPEIRLYVEIVLNLHAFQYNSFDQDSEISPYTREEFVKKDEEVARFIKNRARVD